MLTEMSLRRDRFVGTDVLVSPYLLRAVCMVPRAFVKVLADRKTNFKIAS